MNKEQITKKDVRKDLSKYIKLRKTRLTSERQYTEFRKLEEKAEKLCRKFYNDLLDVSSVSPADFADYLNLFCYGDFKQNCLEKLEQQTGFNTGLYLKTSKRRLGKSGVFKYLPAWKLKLKSFMFRRLCKKIRSSIYFNYQHITKAEALHSEAEKYLGAYLKGEIEIKDKDAKALRDYFGVMFVQKTSEVQGAIDKLNAQIKQSQPEKRVSFMQKLRAKLPAKLKIAIVGAAVVIGGMLGAKSCSGTTQNDTGTLVNKEGAVKPQATDTGVIKIRNNQKTYPVSKVKETAPAKVKTAASETAKIKTSVRPEKMQESSAQAVWKNYYDTVLDILCKGAKKQILYQQIDNQIQKGMFKLPQGVSREKLAYTYVIYQKYGIESSVKNALATTKKLSAEAQNQLAKDISAAGDKGQGVQMMAQKRYGKLSRYSSYNQAGKKLQKKHAHNLQEVFKLKKLSQDSHN